MNGISEQIKAWADAVAPPDNRTIASLDDVAEQRDAGHRRTRYARIRSVRPLAVAAAVVTLVASGIFIARLDDPSPAGRVTTNGPTENTDPPASTTIIAVSTEAGPSQAPEKAVRDSVLPEVAAASADDRVQVLAAIGLDEGTWTISRAPNLPDADGSCLLGAPGGAYGTERICTAEYGEVVLLDDQGRIAKAYPMAGVPPTWLYATDDAVYGGRAGDGGLPDSTLFRIDRATLAIDLIVIPASLEGPSDLTLLPGWRLSTPDLDAAYGRGDLMTEMPHGLPVEVHSAYGRVTIDRAALEAAFTG